MLVLNVLELFLIIIFINKSKNNWIDSFPSLRVDIIIVKIITNFFQNSKFALKIRIGEIKII
jgi:hypothetical protein